MSKKRNIAKGEIHLVWTCMHCGFINAGLWSVEVEGKDGFTTRIHMICAKCDKQTVMYPYPEEIGS